MHILILKCIVGIHILDTFELNFLQKNKFFFFTVKIHIYEIPNISMYVFILFHVEKKKWFCLKHIEFAAN